jgi:hypothetical protein
MRLQQGFGNDEMGVALQKSSIAHVSIAMSLNGIVRPCSCPASDDISAYLSRYFGIVAPHSWHTLPLQLQHADGANAIGDSACSRRGNVASSASSQTTSLDRKVKAVPGHEVPVGIYTTMRAEYTAGPLPAIRLSVAPEHGAVTERRATLKRSMSNNVWRLNFPPFVAPYWPKALPRRQTD